MSALETEARRVIVPLALCHRGIEDLTHLGRKVLARWVAKTAYTLNTYLEQPSPIHIPEKHLHYIKAVPNKLPDGVQVFAYQHDLFEHATQPNFKHPLYYYSSAQGTFLDHPNVTISEELKREVTANSYKVTFMIGGLVVSIAYCSVKRMLFTFIPEIHIPVWPLTFVPATYDNDEIAQKQFSSFAEIAKTFHQSLLIAPPPPGAVSYTNPPGQGLDSFYFFPYPHEIMAMEEKEQRTMARKKAQGK